MTPFSGVRSSWLILARKRDFSVLARSSWAVRSLTRSSSEASTASVFSRSVRSEVASTPISSLRSSTSLTSGRSASPPSQEAASRSTGRTMLRRARSTTASAWIAEAMPPISSTQEADFSAEAITLALG